jgi:hypothetical protein
MKFLKDHNFNLNQFGRNAIDKEFERIIGVLKQRKDDAEYPINSLELKLKGLSEKPLRDAMDIMLDLGGEGFFKWLNKKKK